MAASSNEPFCTVFPKQMGDSIGVSRESSYPPNQTACPLEAGLQPRLRGASMARPGAAIVLTCGRRRRRYTLKIS
jgi:hypothetical protein